MSAAWAAAKREMVMMARQANFSDTLAGRETRLLPGEASARRNCGEEQPAPTNPTSETPTHGAAPAAPALAACALVAVSVTFEDIATGTTCTWRCPIALAVARALGVRPGLVVIDNDHAYCGHGRWVPLPPEVIAFVTLFDLDAPVDPFEFELAFESGVAA